MQSPPTQKDLCSMLEQNRTLTKCSLLLAYWQRGISTSLSIHRQEKKNPYYWSQLGPQRISKSPPPFAERNSKAINTVPSWARKWNPVKTSASETKWAFQCRQRKIPLRAKNGLPPAALCHYRRKQKSSNHWSKLNSQTDTSMFSLTLRHLFRSRREVTSTASDIAEFLSLYSIAWLTRNAL
jgi:hypothetical protein